MWHKIQLTVYLKAKGICKNNGYYGSVCKEGRYRLLLSEIGVSFQALQLWIKITMSNELLDLDTLGKEVVFQSTWLFNCLLGGGKIQREGMHPVLHLGASTARCQVVVRIAALCWPLPSPVGATVDTGAQRQRKSRIKKKSVENAFNDEQVLCVENAFKSAWSCYYFCVIHRRVFELQITASVSDLYWSRDTHV